MTKDDDIRILNKRPTFVIAFSDNHWNEAFNHAIPSFLKVTSQFVIYDLGLSESNVAKVCEFLKVILKKIFFDFSVEKYVFYIRSTKIQFLGLSKFGQKFIHLSVESTCDCGKIFGLVKKIYAIYTTLR